ncbi:imidazoleglycerol-phosphate dehydratase HisB [Archaeoglobales archaeon]|nr:MAG: imidazoleglycerol-phosphate dehydratase HisB [Archaeoglobales archaeon]
MRAVVERRTKEVEVKVKIDFEDKEYSVDTGIPFFDHMLESFAKHAGIGLIIKAKGDLDVDEHHTIEDVAIAMGNAIRKALGNKKGIRRFGDAIVPMDDSVTMCGVDVSGRGFFNFDGGVKDAKNLSAENFIHFFDTLCRNAGINVYMSIKGKNAHHMMESAFKAFALAFKEATEIVDGEVKSTKGTLD